MRSHVAIVVIVAIVALRHNYCVPMMLTFAGSVRRGEVADFEEEEEEDEDGDEGLAQQQVTPPTQ